MSTKDFLLPDLGEGLTEGEVVSWLVAVGDVVEVDQYVAEIETAKAVVEVPSPFGGTIVTLHGEPGDEIAVGSPLITIDIGGDDASGSSAPVEDDTAAVTDETDSGSGSGSDEGESGSVLVGYGTSGGKGSRRRRVGASISSSGGAAQAAPQKVEREGRPMAKPPVRKLAKDLGVDLDYVAGTGPDGIITRADVEAAANGATSQASGVLVTDDEGHTLPSAPPNTPVREEEDYDTADLRSDAKRLAPAGEQPFVASSNGSIAPVPIPPAPEGAMAQERVKLSQLRKAVTAQMTRSRGEIPEAVTWVEADATPLWEFRAELNASQSEVKVSPTAIIMRMAIAALRKFPTVNASLDTAAEEMVLHRHVNLGFAAQTDRGLVVPVIKNAQDMNIIDLAKTLNEMADKARAGKLTPSDMSGGTFTISNYGAFGVDGGDMVINHPEAAILGTGRIADKPWVVDGELAVRKTITYSIAFDHRIIDGGEGAGFIRYLADMTENPTLLTAAL